MAKRRRWEEAHLSAADVAQLLCLELWSLRCSRVFRKGLLVFGKTSRFHAYVSARKVSQQALVTAS
jgi:hypothetical protein